MKKGIFIIGTDTGVGKTVFSAGLLYLFLRNGFDAGYYKPIASGEIEAENSSIPADACFVKTISGYSEEIANVTPFGFSHAVAPHLASRLEKKPIDLDVVREKLALLVKKYDWLLVEGCGGLAVPLNDQGYLLCDLVRESGLDCFLVARAGLGTINHTLLTLEYAAKRGIRINAIFLNGFSGSVIDRDNLETLRKLTGHPAILPVPEVQGVDVDALKPGNLRETFEKEIDLQEIMDRMSTGRGGEKVEG